MKNILMVVENLNINKTSGGIVSSTFVKFVAESGYNITVITENNFDYPVTWLPEDIEIKKFDIPALKKTFLDKIPKVKAIPAYITGFSKLFRNRIECYKKEITNQLSNNEFDMIYALGVGNLFCPHFALAEMDLPIPFYVNIHDPYPMHVYPKPYKKPKTWLNLLAEKNFKIVLDKAERISFPSQLLMQDMSKTFPVIAQKGFVIPHIGTSLPNLPTEKADTIANLDASKINIIHAGSLLGPRNPKFLLQAIAELNQENPDFENKVTFTFIGSVNKDLTDIVANSNLENVHFLTNRISYKKSLDFIAQADASLVIEAIADFSPFMPGKVADIAFAEKTIIHLGPKNSEVKRLLGKEYPYHSELNDVISIKLILKQFLEDSVFGKIDENDSNNLKKYVSIEHNAILIKSLF